MACILAIECLPVTMLRHPWLQARTITASAIFFFVALLFFGRDKLSAMKWSPPPIHKGWATLHVCALALFVATNLYLLDAAALDAGLQHAMLWLWYGALALLPVTLAGSLFSFANLLLLLRSLGGAWSLAAACAALTIFVRSLLMIAWDTPDSRFGQAMQAASFRGVRALLGLFYQSVVADPAHSSIGTKLFAVEVAGPCSGIEGLALILGLTLGWLIYSRRELRIGRALLLVPVSLVLIWLLNLVRIATLIAIGNAGYGRVALGGFHSEAGWILFSCVALGFLLTVNDVSWFRTAGPELTTIGYAAPGVSCGPLSETNPAAIYLLPFLAILAAGLVSEAASDGFESLYALRLLAALGVFYAYRREYRQMDWRFGWLGPAAGAAVFAFWVALDHWMGNRAAPGATVLTGVAEGLARLSSVQRAAWIAVRMLAACVTVPLAEELAFRGYIARRLMSADVESVSFRGLSAVAVLGSSLAFAILHGRMWFAGMLAGAVFALVAKLRGRLGEAVAAHATANLLIAVWVLSRGDYSLW